MADEQKTDPPEESTPATPKRGFAYVSYIILLILGILLGMAYLFGLINFITEVISDLPSDPGILVLLALAIAAVAAHSAALIYAVKFSDTKPTLGPSILLLLLVVVGVPFVVLGSCVALLSGLNTR